MIAPALSTISAKFGAKNQVESSLMLSVFVLAYAVGPLFLGPLSEIYGRVYILQLANLFFLAFNIARGFATSKSQMIAFRFLSGLGGSAPLAIGGGVITDCWTAADRGKATGMYALGPLLGPAIGPVVGAWIVEKSTWRWGFWSTSIFDALIQLSSMVLLKETYAPKILRLKAENLRKTSGNKK
jgi:multidrug resistance protein